MSDTKHIHGTAAPLPTPNLDTDQIMPKQFLRGIDKSGLDKGLLYDLRYDADHQLRGDFVLNQPAYQGASILVGGSNFGCGSSREHAVWGLQQFGIRAVIAPSFGEIFYSNAMNNRLLLVMLDEADVERILADVSDASTNRIAIDVESMTVRSHSVQASFALSERHRHMFLHGLDMIGATLARWNDIDAFQQAHWKARPWLRDIAATTRARLAAMAPGSCL
ncbi:3-isopropylmalate dehydratase small subunit [Ralstonia sp. CHL-2022]|uniref:3-isopropylmalate dehydratase small subunit n=1 Tax=Ralstonia mojiangensis TaxID=2953895 RepID=A0AAE3LBC8_9RALS|nr:3-isopropylmalate dehydratase small subunit [Ralstonia mojiangensis]MCT7309765.1 3-isopropylmalate dehydratase small subunit [Ralstonia mojiangensis]MCT7316820.1 3-isopropylmalate dehydratase small subunit [Ralstonia mojiangensis]